MTRIKRVLGRTRNDVLDVALRGTRRRRFQREFAAARREGQVKVHVGAGRTSLDGWIDTDIQWRCPADLDLTRPWPVPPESVDFIYGDNVIEHLTLAQGRLALRHAVRALAPGGVIRLTTPDVEASARSYLENGELARLGMERNRERGRAFDHRVQLLSQVYVGAEHYRGFIYDYEALAAEMSAVGLTVSREPTGDSSHPELKGLEVRTHAAEAATQLCLEGTKPPASRR